jgi:hypothetical protein
MDHFNDRYSLSPRVGNMDVVATSFLFVLVFGLFSLGSIELMYPEEIQLLYYIFPPYEDSIVSRFTICLCCV